MKVEVAAPSAEWSAWFQGLKATIWPVVAEHAVAIEHVGSTSVAGLPAKPRIDIDVIAATPEAVRACVSALEGAGYAALGDLGVRGREALKATRPSHPHNLYVCLDGCAALRNHLVLRDHLRANPTDRDAYGRLKRELARRHPEDLEAYCAGKTAFVLGILGRHGFDRPSLDAIEAANQPSEKPNVYR